MPAAPGQQLGLRHLDLGMEQGEDGGEIAAVIGGVDGPDDLDAVARHGGS
jgi:hypothetical protein